MGWSWSFIPQRLFTEPSFLELGVIDRGVLLAAYARCDKFGRGPAHPVALRACLSILDGHDVRSSLDRLALAGLLQIYTVSSREVWQLAQYDDDSPAELLRRRGTASQFPPPPGSTPGSSDPGVPPTSAGPSSPGSGPSSPDAAAPPAPTMKDAPGAVPTPPVNHEPTSGNAQQPANDRQATSGNVARRRDETRLEETRSSQEGDSVAPRAPTHPRARTPTREIPAELEQARSAPPPSHPRRANGHIVPLGGLPLAAPPPKPAWPPGTEEAAERWWARLGQERPGPFGSGGYAKTDLLRIALDHPADFVAGVDEHVAGMRGWKRTDPFAWLARQCVFAAERRADARARASTARAPPGDELPAVKKPYEPFRGWHWRWDPPSADTPGLDPAWPSALDLPPDQHESLAWCTSTPEGPVVPPRRLAEVPGAVEAYRQAHTGTEACA